MDEDGMYEIEIAPESSMEAISHPVLDPGHHSELGAGAGARADDVEDPIETMGFPVNTQSYHIIGDHPSYTLDATSEMDYNLSHLPQSSGADNGYTLPDFGLSSLSGLSGGCGHMYDWGSGSYEIAHDNGYGGGYGYGHGSGNGYGWGAAS